MTEREEQDRGRPRDTTESEPLEDLDVREEATREVRGGRTPPPGGPVPVPYPN